MYRVVKEHLVSKETEDHQEQLVAKEQQEDLASTDCLATLDWQAQLDCRVLQVIQDSQVEQVTLVQLVRVAHLDLLA